MADRSTYIVVTTLLVLLNMIVAGTAYWFWSNFELQDPWLLWTLITVPLASLWYLWRLRKRNPTVRLSTLALLRKSTGASVLGMLRHFAFAFSLAGLAILLMSLARPLSQDNWQNVTREGIDIMVALDISASMLAKDFRPNRLESSKAVALRFIDKRPNDRIGLVVYEGEAFTQCPLTTDHQVLKDLFLKIKSGMVEGGTAIGMGLATAVNRLRESDAKSRVIILLTDGVNNMGTVQPLDAAQIASQFGIRVYTIGVGTRGKALSPVAIYPNGQYKYEYVEVDIDEATLQKIAELTGGEYFRATNESNLKDIYEEIDKLERTRIKVTEHSKRNEEYFPFVLLGSCMLGLGLLLDQTLLRTAP